jgi:hypothetical protein
MLIQPTIDKLCSLRLSGMVKAIQQQINDPKLAPSLLMTGLD